jgi:hypothetical protein
MNTIRDRAIKALDFTALKNPGLEAKTGIKATDWSALRNKRVRLNEDHIEGLKKITPEFIYWIMTGETLPEAGQISPEIEETRQNLSTGT